MRKNILWRKENGVDKILENKPEEILGCSMEALTEVFPHWQLGTDKTGRSGLCCICFVGVLPNRTVIVSMWSYSSDRSSISSMASLMPP